MPLVSIAEQDTRAIDISKRFEYPIFYRNLHYDSAGVSARLPDYCIRSTDYDAMPVG